MARAVRKPGGFPRPIELAGRGPIVRLVDRRTVLAPWGNPWQNVRNRLVRNVQRYERYLHRFNDNE